MNISDKAVEELLALADSEGFRADMASLSMRERSPFMSKGRVDVDAYIEFVTQFNEFINHEPKTFRKMIDREMKL